MHWAHPNIAAKWDKEYPNQTGLPRTVKGRQKLVDQANKAVNRR